MHTVSAPQPVDTSLEKRIAVEAWSAALSFKASFPGGYTDADQLAAYDTEFGGDTFTSAEKRIAQAFWCASLAYTPDVHDEPVLVLNCRLVDFFDTRESSKSASDSQLFLTPLEKRIATDAWMACISFKSSLPYILDDAPAAFDAEFGGDTFTPDETRIAKAFWYAALTVDFEQMAKNLGTRLADCDIRHLLISVGGVPETALARESWEEVAVSSERSLEEICRVGLAQTKKNLGALLADLGVPPQSATCVNTPTAAQVGRNSDSEALAWLNPEPLREGFEDHVRTLDPKILFIERCSDNKYKKYGLETLWRGWQAHANWAAKTAKESV